MSYIHFFFNICVFIIYNTVGTRRQPATDIGMFMSDTSKSAQTSPRSVSSFRSSNTGKSSRKTGSSRHSSAGSTGGVSAPIDPTGQIIEMGEEEDDNDYAHLNGQFFDSLKNAVSYYYC